MGHNVEQTFSMNTIDYYSLNGVTNTAFTEALAFVFQGRDLQFLGLQSPDAQAERCCYYDTYLDCVCHRINNGWLKSANEELEEEDPE
jgi:hypothetical protein